MKKILDNSAVSSLGKEITCVDVLELVKTHYDVVLAGAVFRECKNLGNVPLYESVKDLPEAVERDKKFTALVNAIQSINFRLGPGEIESIASSILMTQAGVENYVVIDESLARSIVRGLHLNPRIEAIVGCKIPPIQCTGTIGIIRHMRDKGLISPEISQKIAYDLEISNFRVTPELLDLLR